VFGRASDHASADLPKIKLRGLPQVDCGITCAAVGYDHQAAAEVVEWATASLRVRKRWRIAEMDNGTHRSRRTRVRGRIGRAARALGGATSSEFTWRWLTTVALPVAADGRHWVPRALVGRIFIHKGSDQDSLTSGSDFFNLNSLRNRDIPTGRYSAIIFSVIVAYSA
jgi:hypothetical protein